MNRDTIERHVTRDALVRGLRDLNRHFIGNPQWSVMSRAMQGEERQFFIGKVMELAKTVATMPRVYEQDGKGEKAIAYLHYFTGSADWWITERDTTPHQLQAFGLADLFGDGGELGYISIAELIDAGAELDLHFTPTTLEEVKRQKGI